jgi:type IV pilus assembly protein PilY1
MRMAIMLRKSAFFVIAVAAHSLAFGLNISDDFTQGAVNDSPGNGNGMDWAPVGTACLTAGTSTNNSTSVATTNSKYSNIPACNTISGSGITTTPEAVGSGALRLTNAATGQVGAIVSNGTFPSNQGIQVTFTTYTYQGSTGTSPGGDGMGFFLQDASIPLTLPYVGANITDPTTSSIGPAGGSLGYACSLRKDSNTNGITGGYLGLGMDEFGNFTNGGGEYYSDVAATSPQSPRANPGRLANTIALRGAGNVSWYYLNNQWPSLYPTTTSSADQMTIMHNTCRTGVLQQNTTFSITSTSALSWSSTNSWLTVTVPSNHGFAVGDIVNISSPVMANGMKSGGNWIIGSYDVKAVPTSKSFSVYFPDGGTSITAPGSSALNTVTANLTYTTSALSWSSGSGGVLTVTVGTNVGFKVGDTVNIASSSATLPPKVNGTSIVGTYVVTGVSGKNFTIAYPNGSTTYANASNGKVSVKVMDYPYLAGSAVTLPSTTPMWSNAATRSAAQPITYKLSISPGGLLNFLYSFNGGAFQPVLTNSPITASNGTLPANFRFGFLSSTGNATSIHEITCFAAQPTESGSSAAANTVQSGQVRTGTQVYLASYNPNTWAGSLVSDAIVNTNGVLSVSSTAQWDADCVLTGGGCSSMGSVNGVPTNTLTAQAPTSRNILTWNGSAGVPFQWANLTSAQQSLLNSTDTAGSNRVDWLRGVRTQEQVSSGAFRTRAGVLGDIIDSSPTWVGPPSKNYGASFTDALTGAAGPESSYLTFKSNLATRLNVVYSGSNDGMLHGFRSGANYSDGSYDSRLNDGTEVLAFVPAGVLSAYATTGLSWSGGVLTITAPNHDFVVGDTVKITSVSSSAPSVAGTSIVGSYVVTAVSGSTFSVSYPSGSTTYANVSNGLVKAQKNSVASLTDPLYTHSFFVDAAPGYGDVYYAGAWHTWLVGGKGPGGAEIYALDITDPSGIVTSTLSFSESHAASLVKGDWTPASLTSCTNATSNCGNNLGNTYGIPLVRRLHNGKWAIIFGNGIGSTNGHAGVYIGVISPTDGSVSFVWLDTGSGGTGSSANGIASVASADLDADFVIDYLYAGDLQGNVWRFDLTSSDPTVWAASKFGQPTATPLFIATDSSGNRQPITSSIAVTATLTGSAQRVILGFGTGRATPFTTSSATTYQSGTQSVYGIWDWDMSTWNALPNTQTNYGSLAAVTASPYRTFTRTDLATSTVATQTATTRTAAVATVCWNGSTACGSGNTQYGWKFDLPDSHEQVIYNPVFSGGEMLLNTIIPPQNSVGQCILSLPTGWTMAFNMASGGGQPQNVFPDASGSLVVASGASGIVGLKLGAVGTPYIVAVGSQQYVISSDVDGGPANINQLNTQGGVTVKPVSWEQLR